MAIPTQWNLVERGLYDSKHSMLVVSDLHLGRRVQNKPYPKMEHEEIKSRLVKMIEKTGANELVLNGDVYTQYPPDEQGLEMFYEIEEKLDKIKFILGNHEEDSGSYPSEIEDRFEVSDCVTRDELLVHHGHNKIDRDGVKYHVIGHIHPIHKARNIFLWGENAYMEHNVLILPGFSDTLGGADITGIGSTSHCPILDEGEDIEDYDMIFCRE